MKLKDMDWENICEIKNCPKGSNPYQHTHCLTEKGTNERIKNRKGCILCHKCKEELLFKCEAYVFAFSFAAQYTVFECPKCDIDFCNSKTFSIEDGYEVTFKVEQ